MRIGTPCKFIARKSDRWYVYFYMLSHRAKIGLVQNTASDNSGRLWVRFPQYDISRAGCIQPLQTEFMSFYDPWIEVRIPKTKPKVSNPPYVSLLDLAGQIRLDRKGSSGWHGSEESRAAVLNWCARFGLLGILPAVCSEAILYPRYITWPEDSRKVAQGTSVISAITAYGMAKPR